MSKLICDVCGTSYPDTATQCPICGCVSTASAQSVSGSAGEGTKVSSYNYVKGGRFSKSNVRKRNSSAGSVSANIVSDSRKRSHKKASNDNKGLVIVAIILVLAIVAVLLFMVVRFLLKDNGSDDRDPNETTATVAPTDDEDATVSCERIYFDLNEVVFDKAGTTEKLVVVVEPEDCNEPLGEVTSENPEVATATLKDNVITVTAVGPGETKIKLTCGSATAVCSVKCDFEAEKELIIPTEIELTKKGQKKDIYPSDILRTDIEWTSDDEKVATVSNGTVTAVKEGTTVIRAKYKDQTVECVVNCNFAEEEDDSGNNETTNDTDNNDSVIQGNGGVTEDGGSATTGSGYALATPYGDPTDISLFMSGNKIASLRLVDSAGNTVSGVTWSTADSEKCTVTDGKVTAVGVGTTKVTATYNGQTYTCTIRVHD